MTAPQDSQGNAAVPANAAAPGSADRIVPGSRKHAPTAQETVGELHRALGEYIEATYHISHPSLVAERHSLLQLPGVIAQRPFFESTPRYRKHGRFSDIEGLPTAVLDLFSSLSKVQDGPSDPKRLIFDPPYEHQLKAVETALVGARSSEGETQRDLIVMTGTGSGKTEAFLLPILGKLVNEAAQDGTSFGSQAAVRALVLYPMNALVNDQLGRMRLLFADPRVTSTFTRLSGRPARFARYTSRTLYPGVRKADRDQARLKPIEAYYIEKLDAGADAAVLVDELRARGKWPAKNDLKGWYGAKGSRWQAKDGSFVRCVTLPGDAELLTRHEVQQQPPDVLITNYSMLEYMLMRPLERPVFERTREWLQANPGERFLLVLDEAHLYRGAGGTEVALLIRRLRARLGIGPERLQVICTSASFSNEAKAATFGAQLTGKSAKDFRVITGTLDLRVPDGPGSAEDASLLASIDLDAYHDASTIADRLPPLRPLFNARGIAVDRTSSAAVQNQEQLERLLHDALAAYAPLNRLINLTMRQAWSLPDLETALFPEVEAKTAAHATTTLMTLGSAARPTKAEPGLLPCRVHAFFRGLPGLWVCMNQKCTELPAAERDVEERPCGKLYAQPRERCECGAQVLEFYTCRHCGSAYARGYTDNLVDPRFLWAEGGEAFRDDTGSVTPLHPLDILLEPDREEVQHVEYDVLTGRIDAPVGPYTRTVAIRKERTVSAAHDDADATPSHDAGDLGQFIPCGVCGRRAGYGRSSVQDHQTKGDQPFHALVSRQIQVQPPGPQAATPLAPHRGRKVLIFSDSRQTAARLAPNLQKMSMRDVVRPLVVAGTARLKAIPGLAARVSLDDLYSAVLVAAHTLNVRLRPELSLGETFEAERRVADEVNAGKLADPFATLGLLGTVKTFPPPQALFRSIFEVLTDPFTGLEALALGSVCEVDDSRAAITSLPALGAVASSDEQKLALARIWFGEWLDGHLFLAGTPTQWIGREVRAHSGKFSAIKRLLATQPGAEAQFNRDWLPKLLGHFCTRVGGTATKGVYHLLGSRLTLSLDGAWEFCEHCRGIQRPWPEVLFCQHCGSNEVKTLDVHSDAVFAARKGFYRRSALEALAGTSPMALIAAEHTAQIGTAQVNEIYSRAEEHELLFQDVPLEPDARGRERAAIDVLSCTTTMEVGIDIGSLSGVALRNMPPARANYQQRAGRAGRRGNAIATVIALASADSHDEHFFAHPADLVAGSVLDPTLTLDNRDIARRHVTAFLIQRYHGARLPNPSAAEQTTLFEVLGTVQEFRDPRTKLNRHDLAAWLAENESVLREELADWLPMELGVDARGELMRDLVSGTMASIDAALAGDAAPGAEEEEITAATPDEGTSAPSEDAHDA